MLDFVPVRVWLLIVAALVAWAPAQYVIKHIVHSPSRRDITQPPEDLGWRTTGQLARSGAILAALLAFSIFIFTPYAEAFARSPQFYPILMGGLGAWVLYTVPAGIIAGRIQPFIRGFHDHYLRETQPKRFWASLGWNALLGCLFIWLTFQDFSDPQSDPQVEQCYDEKGSYSPQQIISACTTLIDSGENSAARLNDYLVSRGIAYQQVGDLARAMADYDKAIRLNPKDYYAFFNRGLANMDSGHAKQAAADFTVAIRLRPKDGAAYFQRGVSSLNSYRVDESLADFTKAHELMPRDPWPLANRGVAYAWKQDEARARQDLNAARAIDPTNYVMLHGEAILAMSARDYDTAVARLSQALKQNPNDKWALGLRSDAYELLGEQDKANADSDRLWQLNLEEKQARSRKGA